MKTNNIFKDILLFIVLAFLLCVFMSGCSKSTVPENELLSYVKQNNPMESRMHALTGDIQYYDFEVEKRLTDKDVRSDRVWVNFSADSDRDSADVEACMYFTLYNDGWQLDNIEILSAKFSPLAAPSREIVSAYLAERYDYFQYQDEEVHLENGLAKFYYKAMNEYAYADFGYDLCVNYFYSYSEHYWFFDNVEILSETQDWTRITGEWELVFDYSGAYGPELRDMFSLTIDDFDGSVLYGSYLVEYTFKPASGYDTEWYGGLGPFSGYDTKFLDQWVLDAQAAYFLIDKNRAVEMRKHNALMENSGHYLRPLSLNSGYEPFSLRFFDDSSEVETGYRN